MKISETTERIIDFLIENLYLDIDKVENIENLKLGITKIMADLINKLI